MKIQFIHMQIEFRWRFRVTSGFLEHFGNKVLTGNVLFSGLWDIAERPIDPKIPGSRCWIQVHFIKKTYCTGSNQTGPELYWWQRYVGDTFITNIFCRQHPSATSSPLVIKSDENPSGGFSNWFFQLGLWWTDLQRASIWLAGSFIWSASIWKPFFAIRFSD